MQITIAVLELLGAAGFWGFGLVAAVWALQDLTAWEITFYRFLFASSLLAVVVLVPNWRKNWRRHLKWGLVPGFFLSSLLIFQTVGLQFTSATKSGFITVFYVLIVPVFEMIFFRRAVSILLFGFIVTALIGMILISGVGFEAVNLGDVLTLIGAFMAAGHILSVGHISRCLTHPFLFNLAQVFWAAVFSGVAWIFVPAGPKAFVVGQWSSTTWIGMLSLTIGSTLLAFYLQVRAQARLSPTLSGLLFLLESPFAMFFAIIFLGEHLGWREQLGAALIFVSAIGAVKSEKTSIRH